MCSGLICGVVTIAVGTAFLVASSLLGFYFIPTLVQQGIINEVILLNDTIQMERFQEIPFPLSFKVRIFNITNAEDVLQGNIPVVNEIGPYVYKLYQKRLVESMEEDKLTYRIVLSAVFDPEASYPLTEDDIVHVVNVAYHGILQVAESTLPSLIGMLNLAMNGVFGADQNAPIAATRVGSLLFEGISLCSNPGLVGGVACGVIRAMTTDIQNMELQPDNSIKFSIFAYRNNQPSSLYDVYRGIGNHADLGRIRSLDGNASLSYWTDAEPADNSTAKPSVCNMINGTDSGIFAPFVNRDKPLFALNTDICRSVELRYQEDVVYKGIPAVRFAAHEWFLDNDDGCFCLNVTRGITRSDGCLLRGAVELFSCVGAYMVLSYPHFLYADDTYRNGVRGLSPSRDDHRLFMDIEPNTGTVIRGAKRAQFNVFIRAIEGIPATQNLQTTLVPILWIEEGVELEGEYVDMMTNDVVGPLNLISILVPVVVALSCTVLLTGITIVLCLRFKKKKTV